MKYLCFVSGLLSTILFFACKQQNDHPGIEEILANSIKKFPQLPKGNGKLSDYYGLVRSVRIGVNDVELQLRSAPMTLEDPQQIILIITKSGQMRAIPFFSNTYHDYWNFYFDSSLSSVKPTNTTFEKELKDCLVELNLYKAGTANHVIHEMFNSLIHCRLVNESDSAGLQVLSLTDNDSLTYEDFDSCRKRLKENWLEMKKAFHPDKFRTNYNALWDQENKRVYQLFDVSNKTAFKIKNYRLDAIFHTYDL